jgi:hypothetical protein
MGEPVKIAENALQAIALLRAEVYTAVVFDDPSVENDLEEMDTALSHLETAIPIHVNLAICGARRLVREVRAAQRRRNYEEASARAAAERSLRAELSGTLTTVLLGCELALETSGLPELAVARLASVHDAARKLLTQLQVGQQPE